MYPKVPRPTIVEPNSGASSKPTTVDCSDRLEMYPKVPRPTIVD